MLLYGSETWCLPKAEVKALEGFHVAAALILTGMRPKQARDGSWEYPSTKVVLGKAGLHTISAYIGTRRSHIAQKIAARPVLEECKRAERRRGTPPRQFWWEQDLCVELPPWDGGDETDEG